MMLPVSVVIPTYQREEILLQSVSSLLSQSPSPAEILLIDQTEKHDANTDKQLRKWEAAGRVRWIQRKPPSIVDAMNHGLIRAAYPWVLYLDDDIKAHEGLVKRHYSHHQSIARTVGYSWARYSALAIQRRHCSAKISNRTQARF